MSLVVTARSSLMRMTLLVLGCVAALFLASVVAKGADVDNGPPPAAVASLPPAVIDHGPAGASAPADLPPVVIPAADVSHRVTRSLTRAPHGHTHTCPRGHTWDHAENPTHTCQAVLPNGQRCGLQQYTQDATPRAVTVGDWPPATRAVEFAPPAPAADPLTYSLSGGSGGCSGAGCSTSQGFSGNSGGRRGIFNGFFRR